jgi:2-keto-3-deoxy-L-rhamnonate aldolase RhmA
VAKSLRLITPNRIRAALAGGRVPLGMQCFTGSAAIIEIIGFVGFDFVMIDTEHASLNEETVEHLIRAADSVGLTALVRVSHNHATPIRKALEAGAAGVIVPQVRSAREVSEAVAAARYPPLGSRGMCPATRASQYSIAAWPSFRSLSDSATLVVPIIEHPDAVEAIDAICSLDGVDVVFFGPADLGLAMGVGAVGLGHPQVREALEAVIDACAKRDVAVMGVPYPDSSVVACQELIRSGVRILMHSVDELLFYEVCRGIVTDLAETLSAAESGVGSKSQPPG